MSKHLSLEEREAISYMLNANKSFKAIGQALGRDCTTISKEVRSHIKTSRVGMPGRPYNNCRHRFNCSKNMLCPNCMKRRMRNRCSGCPSCNNVCDNYEPDFCLSLQKPPYVCNGCKKRTTSCTLEKKLYIASHAHNSYKDTFSESHKGICLTENEVKKLDLLVSPLLKKGQSIHHIYANHQDEIMVSESTIYRLVDYSLFEARNIDLPRKVRYAKRMQKKHFKIDKFCRTHRTYEDFKRFLENNPDTSVVEIDSVEGIKGGKVLLTIHFKKAECMLAILRDKNDSQSVIDAFNRLYFEMRPDIFTKIFPVLLGDNGSEFSNPCALEFDAQGNRRTHIFYCDPSAPHQKGSAERNHEFIRMFVPKGKSFDSFTQKDISLMMNHINSYSRKSLGDKTPYDVMEFLYGHEILSLLGCQKIHPDEVTLNPSIFEREDIQE